MKQLVRKNILKIQPYQPGKPIEELQRELGLKDVIKLASNENPLGPSPKALEAIKEALKDSYRYPDSACFYLKKKLATKLKLSESNLIIGNGSDEIITLALRAFVDEGEEVIVACPTFLIYEIAAKIQGAKLIKIPLKGLRYDLKRMKEAITPKTKIIFIANPDNPTGTYVTDTEVEDFFADLPKGVIVYFDEAYYEYASGLNDYPDTLRYLRRENIIITRSFSKAYGLAGLRIGYGITRPKLIEYIERVREPFNVNSLAQKAAIAALDDEEFLIKTKRIVDEGKRYLYENFRKLNLRFLPSATNFILFDVGRKAQEVFKKLLQAGIIVRDMGLWRLDDFLRVTVGTMEENRRFIQALKKVL
jgi:histidinol-phosphate aminotransferase